MKSAEFVRWLKSQGVEIKNGTKHYKAYYKGKQTTVPRHPGSEIDDDFAKRIKKQLGMK
jgi:mRNA interferase HicA